MGAESAQRLTYNFGREVAAAGRDGTRLHRRPDKRNLCVAALYDHVGYGFPAHGFAFRGLRANRRAMWDRLLTDCNIATMDAAVDAPFGAIEDGAIAIQDGRILRVGRRVELAGNRAKSVEPRGGAWVRSEEHTSALQSLMRLSIAV